MNVYVNGCAVIRVKDSSGASKEQATKQPGVCVCGAWGAGIVRVPPLAVRTKGAAARAGAIRTPAPTPAPI